MGEAIQALFQQAIDKKVAEGRNKRDREKITGMLQKGKKPQEIADFCDYPMDLIMEVAKSLKQNITVTVVEEAEDGKGKTK